MVFQGPALLQHCTSHPNHPVHRYFSYAMYMTMSVAETRDAKTRSGEREPLLSVHSGPTTIQTAIPDKVGRRSQTMKRFRALIRKPSQTDIFEEFQEWDEGGKYGSVYDQVVST